MKPQAPIGSFERFCQDTRIISRNAMLDTRDERIALLDRDSRFRQALRDFAAQVEAYRGVPRRAAPKPKPQDREDAPRSYGTFRSVLMDEAEHREVMEKLRLDPPYKLTDCESWFDRIEKIKKAANMPPRELGKLALEESTWLALVRRLPGANIGDEEARELRRRMLSWVNSEII